ncbi:hypothetical protein TNCV_3904121 [Trichonephila clavipes]|nr:hypothetical protein TNCV_3904121 [Trichonephila clavipes]
MRKSENYINITHEREIRGVFVTVHVLLKLGQVTRTTHELALPSPNYHTTPTGGLWSYRVFFSSDEAHFWLNGYVNKQNCSIWSEANPQVYVETPLHTEKLTVWGALWAGGILLQKR